MRDSPHLSPTLAAMMCDGMGWFSRLDYKRMLLVYDRIYYLLPSKAVEFEDIGGERQSLYFPIQFQQRALFEICHDVPERPVLDLIFAAAKLDTESERFRAGVDSIPAEDRLYTWRIANADADLGGGASPALKPSEQALAHAALLNKFLLAADRLNCIPINRQAIYPRSDHRQIRPYRSRHPPSSGACHQARASDSTPGGCNCSG